MFLPNEDSLWVSIYNIVTAINQIKLFIRDALAEMHLFPFRDSDQISSFLLDFPQFISVNIFLNLPSRPQP